MLLVGVLMLCGWGPSAVYGASETGGFRIFTLKHISAAQGKKYLAEVGIGTVSQLAGSASLLITGKPEDLGNAKVLLGLVDAPQEYVVRSLPTVSAMEEMPSGEAISEKVGNVSVGTFAAPPKSTDSAGAIIDVHNGSLVVVAQAGRVERIVAAIGQLLEEKKAAEETSPTRPTPVEPTTDPNRPAKPGVDKIEVVGPADANAPRKAAVGPTRTGPTRPGPARPAPGKVPAAPFSIYRPGPVPNGRADLRVDLPTKLEIVLLLLPVVEQVSQ